MGPGGPREAIDTFSRGQYIGPIDELRDLVAPLLARMARGETEDLDPAKTSRRITALIFAGIAPR